MPGRRTAIISICILSLTLLLSLSSCALWKKKEVKERPLTAEENLEKANELIEKGYYEEARTVLSGVGAEVSTHYAELARLRTADTYFEDGAYDEASVEYQSFLDSYPYHKHASYAQYKLAMSFFKRIKTVDVSYSTAKRALQEFERLQKAYPRNPYMEVTESRIKVCQRMLAEYEFYVGNFYYKKGAYMAAALRFNELLQNYPDSTKESETLYYLGISYDKMGLRERALMTLNTLIEKYPTNQLSNDARKLISSFK